MDGPNPRILKEVQKNLSEPVEGVLLFDPDPEDFRHFFIEIQGPKDSLYAGGKFKLEIQLPQQYPMMPPKANFKTNIYHPWIDPTQGLICLEELKQRWSPVYQIRTILQLVMRLLREPNEEGTFNASAAEHWRKNRKEAEEKAREYTKLYAK